MTQPHDRSLLRRTSSLRRRLLPLVPPLLGAGAQWLVWPWVGPQAWFLLFYPSLFVSSWLGNIRSTVFATVLSCLLVWWIFVPAEWALLKDIRHVLPFVVFLGMGLLFGVFHEGLRRANHAAAHALAQSIGSNRRAEEAKLRLSELVEQAPEGIFVADLSGRYTEVNSAGCALLGYTREELLGKSIVDLLPPEDIDRLWQTQRRLLAGETDVGEWTLRSKQGVSVPVEVNAKILPDGRWQGFVRDLRKRKEQQEALRLSEERFRVALADSPGIVFHQDRELKYTFVHNLPIGLEHVLGKTDRDFMRAEEAEVLISLKRRVLDEGIAQRETICATLAGRPRYHDLRLEPLRNAAGEVVGLTGASWDITERRSLEETLRLSEAKLSGILASSADAIISVDEEQRITMFNEGAEHIFGYSAKELVGVPLDVLIPARFAAAHRQHVRHFSEQSNAARRMGQRGAEIVGLRKNGEEFPADAAISKLEVGGKRVLTVALRDITEQKRLEQGLRRAVRERDDVLGVVAHDLRNPLNAIALQAQHIERSGEDGERARRSAAAILRSVGRMDRLIQDLLDVARLEAGELTLQRDMLEPGALIHDAVDSLRPIADSSSLELRTNVRPQLTAVIADRDRLLQVFENLIGNALKFTEAGGSITVAAEPCDGEVLFSVTDTGRGIAPAELPHVFDRFWQAQKSGRRGAGLGLAIVKGIVDAHGGRVWVESVPEHGSTFFLALPAAPYVRKSSDCARI